MSNYFPKSYRLNNDAAFSHLLTEGTRCNADPYLRLIWRANSISNPRLGLRITKKIVSRAVDRNRIKRLIRESFRLNQSCLGSCDILVSIRKGIEQLDNKTLQQRLNLLWKCCPTS